VRAAAFLVPAAVCVLWTLGAGKDVNWDLLNYHYYAPWQLLEGRLAQDFFAASAQSYLNPVGYVPFYLMVSSGWHSLLASSVLAGVHGLSLTLLYFLARRLFAHLPPREQTLFSCLGTALGAATWVFWPTVGSSFLDPLLMPLILGGLLSLIDGKHALLAGVLFGTAAALKYSNGIYVLAALPLVLSMRAALAYLAGAALAIAVLAGPWMLALLREFGNPVFPLMNAWFESPHALPVNLVSERFTPRGFAEALAIPFRMVALDRHVYSEIFAPDLRLALLMLAGLALPLAPRQLTTVDRRMLIFLASGAVLWILSSANARYGLPVLLLAGLALARLAEHLLPRHMARIALATLLVVQVATSLVAAPTRWFLAEPWSARWLPYDVPERALREPALYLSVEVQPMAVVAPFLHPGSAFVNFSGLHSLPADAPRLVALLERYRGRVRVLGRMTEPRAYNNAVRRLGLRVDPGDCFTVEWRAEREPSPEPLSVASCALVAAARDAADVEAERRMSALFERIEKRCAALLRGQTAVTEPFGTAGWSRNYPGLDARLEAFGGSVLLHRYRNATVLELGRLSDWARDDAPLPPACR
jgi:hypothetical protein